MHPISIAKKAGAHFAAATWLAAAAVACDAPPVSPCYEPDDCRERDASTVDTRRDTPSPPDGATSDAGAPRNALCGNMGCFPGNWNACGSPAPLLLTLPQVDDASSETDVVITQDASSDATADALDGSGSSDAKDGECQDATRDGSSSPDASGDASAPDAPGQDASPPDDASAPDASVDNGIPPTSDGSVPMDTGSGRPDAASDLGMDEPRIAQSCYIRPGATGVITQCAPVGLLLEGSPCNDSPECEALRACVEVDQKTACRRVSCGATPDCLKGTYYREAPLRARGVTRLDLPIPVCVPTDNCILLEPNQCPAGKVCAVVGTEGDTTCLEPGSAKVGEACDENSGCSEGLLCSKLANQCVKICHVASPLDCPTGICQGSNRSLPDGFGICVGQIDGG